jgi:hypothetical protein
MDHVPHVFIALEQSGLGAMIRQSAWLYPIANVGHIVSLVVFAGAVAIMDARLLGAFIATPPAAIVRPARRLAIAALLAQMLSGSVLFTAEAGHLALNPVFQVKIALVALGLFNALVVAQTAAAVIAAAPASMTLPMPVRVSAALSLLIWASVAMLGRLIAYV